jgi:hypothetical protein
LQKRRFGRRVGLDQLDSVIFDVPDRLAELPSSQDVFRSRTRQRGRIAIDPRQESSQSCRSMDASIVRIDQKTGERHLDVLKWGRAVFRVGAMFQIGVIFGSVFTVPKIFAMASAGRKCA